MIETRARRSYLSVPGSNGRMIAKSRSLSADEVFLDLEDSVAPKEKEAARERVAEAIRMAGWKASTIAVRINSIHTQWGLDDLCTIVAEAGAVLDCILVPKIELPEEVKLVDRFLDMLERKYTFDKKIGIEVLIESATALRNVQEIAYASPRVETLIFGPADMSASLGLPTVTTGLPMPGYPGDHWHWVMASILVAARSAGIQAIDGPYLVIRDLEGLREMSLRVRALGFDGKWALHPLQIEVVNEVFTPVEDVYHNAKALLPTLRAGQGRRAVRRNDVR